MNQTAVIRLQVLKPVVTKATTFSFSSGFLIHTAAVGQTQTASLQILLVRLAWKQAIAYRHAGIGKVRKDRIDPQL